MTTKKKITEFEKGMRLQLKNYSFSSHRKPMKDLTSCELKNGLDNILKQNYSFFKISGYGTTEDYKKIFKKTFQKELKLIKICEK